MALYILKHKITAVVANSTGWFYPRFHYWMELLGGFKLGPGGVADRKKGTAKISLSGSATETAALAEHEKTHLDEDMSGMDDWLERTGLADKLRSEADRHIGDITCNPEAHGWTQDDLTEENIATERQTYMGEQKGKLRKAYMEAHAYEAEKAVSKKILADAKARR